MPIYEYKCEKCGALFEKLIRLGGGREVRCPECGGADCRRQLSLVAAAVAKEGAACNLKFG